MPRRCPAAAAAAGAAAAGAAGRLGSGAAVQRCCWAGPSRECWRAGQTGRQTGEQRSGGPSAAVPAAGAAEPGITDARRSPISRPLRLLSLLIPPSSESQLRSPLRQPSVELPCTLGGPVIRANSTSLNNAPTCNREPVHGRCQAALRQLPSLSAACTGGEQRADQRQGCCAVCAILQVCIHAGGAAAVPLVVMPEPASTSPSQGCLRRCRSGWAGAAACAWPSPRDRCPG